MNNNDCGSPKSLAKRAFKEEIRSRNTSKQSFSKNKKHVRIPKSKSPEKFVFTNYISKNSSFMETSKKESPVSKVIPTTSDTTQKGVKSFRNYVFQAYSSNDPNWKGILPTPTLLKSRQTFNKWKVILPNPPRSKQTFQKPNNTHVRYFQS